MESLGARLKREREQRKITLEDVSVSTKIGTRFLTALEEDQFDQLPGGIFNKGFVRAYARHLGIDEEQAVAEYLAASGANQPDPKAEEVPLLEVRAEEPRHHVAARIPWGILATALVVIAVGFTLWGFRTREKPAQPAARIEPTTSVNAAPAAPAAELKNTSATPAAEPVNSSGSNANSAAPNVSMAAKPAEEPAPSGVQLASATTAVAAKRAGSFVVSIKAREDAWISITADGKQIMQDILVAPVEKAVAARSQIVIKTGNAGGLDFSFNGRKLPLQGDYGEVKTLTFGANGLQPIPAHAQAVSNN